MKKDILRNVCYTELVYGRINKKLKTQFNKDEIEEFIFKVLEETDENDYSRVGKNYYVLNNKHNVRITINSNTYRVITAGHF